MTKIYKIEAFDVKLFEEELLEALKNVRKGEDRKFKKFLKDHLKVTEEYDWENDYSKDQIAGRFDNVALSICIKKDIRVYSSKIKSFDLFSPLYNENDDLVGGRIDFLRDAIELKLIDEYSSNKDLIKVYELLYSFSNRLSEYFPKGKSSPRGYLCKEECDKLLNLIGRISFDREIVEETKSILVEILNSAVDNEIGLIYTEE